MKCQSSNRVAAYIVLSGIASIWPNNAFVSESYRPDLLRGFGFGESPKNNSVDSADTGKWRLVRTAGPDKGADVVSLMHTADALKSDPDFAGLVIRCRGKNEFQISFVVVQPFPPRARPEIVINDGRSDVRFTATVLPSGTTLESAWRSGSAG